MITQTARKHIMKALREALHIPTKRASEILEEMANYSALRLAEGIDMRGVKALVSNDNRHVDLYALKSDGYEFSGIWISIGEQDLVRWNTLGLEEAYAIALEVHDNRGPAMRAADERMAAEAAEKALGVQDDLLPEEAMDAAFGSVPEARDWTWTNGKLIRAGLASSGDHVVVLAELADGGRKTMAMFPLFSGPDELLTYAVSQIGVDARLCVGGVNAFDNDVPQGFDRSMPVLDMILRVSDVPAIMNTMRRAA